MQAGVRPPTRKRQRLRSAGRPANERQIGQTAWCHYAEFCRGDWRPYADRRGERPIANGQFFLLRGTVLAAVGGFAAFAHQPLVDVALAGALTRAGFRGGFLRAGGGLTVRMYSGLGAALAGWRPNLAVFLGDRPGIAATALLLVGATVGCAAVLLARGALLPALLLWLGGAGASSGRAAALAAAAPGAGSFPSTCCCSR